MCASPFSFLRAGPPPPKVVLLPDALFFTRSVPIAAGATAPEAAAQIELAIEGISPFPLAQLYYGWFWSPGAERALVFAAYRRRFTAEQAAAWEDAELVLPAFAAVAGAEVEGATTIVLSSPEGLTAVYWEQPPVPAKVIFRPLAPEATEEERAQAREELLRGLGGSKEVIELATPPVPDAPESDGEVIFRAEGIVSRLPAATAAAMDVRDKAELAALRGARRRDVMLWRVLVGCAAALLVFGLGELALVGGKAWQKIRVTTLNRQRPAVERIMASEKLTTQINDLVKKRLLPFEMLAFLAGEDASRRMPQDIVFNRAYTNPAAGIYTLFVDAFAKDIGQITVYENVLRQLPAVQNVDVREIRPRGNEATFQLVVVFKPEALKPMTLPGAPVEGTAKPASTAPQTRPLS